ncbi:MAG TPA: OmpA family protein [Steroidobacteraceae bacterium]|nr:OmpA family protein [Steroidobacteraceae bacterium]
MNAYLGPSVVVAGIALLTVGIARAGQPEESWYVAPGVHAMWMDDDRHVDDDWGANLAFGKAVNKYWNLEADAWYGQFDGAGGDDLQVSSLGINALAVFYRESRIAPFILFGGGAQKDDFDLSGDSTNPYVDLGAGVLITLTHSADCSRGLILRAEARGRNDFVGGQQDRFVDYMAGLKLQFYWGGKSCLHEEEKPLPPPPPPAAPLDSDGDGVTDNVDRCPGTAAGVPVDASGCELDTDGDGVPDHRDKCPNTPKGDRVDADGCSLTRKLEVFFDNNSSQLKPASYEDLNLAVEFLKRVPAATGIIEGHTDSSGSEAYNQHLSEARAKAVREYMVSMGIDASRLEARGYGESQPVADNATAEGRAQNRRVVLHRTDQQ